VGYQFTLLLDRMATKAEVAALVTAHDDISTRNNRRDGTCQLWVDRCAPTMLDAVLSAVRDLDAVGLPPVGLVNDDAVTLEDVAARIGRSREAVRRWSVGRHGPGGFPSPLNPGGSTNYYRWSSVVRWLREAMSVDLPDDEPVLAAVDLALQLRALAPQVDRIVAIRDLIAD
jgi:hypothetical protein